MSNIVVGRYDNPEGAGWAGWIEPEDRAWIMFVGLDGQPVVYLDRDPSTGAIR